MDDAKQTSGLMFSYFKQSAYHDSCVPAEKRPGVVQDSKTYRDAEYTNCDQVSQDTVWKQAVASEKRCLNNWETQWGFLAEFDAQILAGSKGAHQGNQKEPVKLPEKSTMFSESVPNTNSGNYGYRVKTELGATMSKMEYEFYSGGRRKKMGRDMICY